VGTDPAPACDTLYYDGQCSLCAAEIDSLRRERGAQLALVDIHSLQTPVEERDSLLRTLHLRRADGSWLRGADANVAAWEGTPKARLLGVLRWPFLRHVVDLGYRAWAAWRYRRLYGPQFSDEQHASRTTGH
jgi:predicted DCC family thiol-disulfide oxidoreductase YuxK